MSFEIDTSTEFGAKTARRVEDEKLVWLTTVDSRGFPQPNPVWFLWADESFLIFSRPNQAKLSNIARSGRVSLNFEATDDEEQVTIFTGMAEIVSYAALPKEVFDRYAAKYAEGMERIELPRLEYEKAYSVAIRVTPERLRGW